MTDAGGGNPATYRQNWSAAAPQWRRRMLASSAFTVLLVISVATFFGRNLPPQGQMVGMGLLAAVVGLAILRSWRQTMAAARSLEVTITDEGLTLRRGEMPELHIDRVEITALEHKPGVGIDVRTPSKLRGFVIPETLEGFPEIRERVGEWLPITLVPMNLQKMVAITAVAGFGAMVAMAVVMVSTRPAVVIPLAMGLFILLAWCFHYVANSPHIDAKQKKMRWILLFPMAGMVGRIIAVLMMAR